MEKQDFNDILIHIIQNSSSDILELREVLVKYKEMGTNQTEMLNSLSLLRDKLGEEKEDIILDLMDFVTGFCNPSLNIYEE